MFSNQYSRLRLVIPFSSRVNTFSAPLSSAPRDHNGGAGRGDYLLLLGGCGDERELRVGLVTKSSGAWTLLRSSGAKLTLEGKCHNLNHPQTLPTLSWGSSEGTSRSQRIPIDLEPYCTVGRFAGEANHVEFEYYSSETPANSVSTLSDLIEGRPWPKREKTASSALLLPNPGLVVDE